MRKLIRTDGTEVDLPNKVNMKEIHKMIGADTLDTFTLTDRVHVVLVDDLGHQKRLSVNQKATELYWKRTGGPVDHRIVGDVVIVPDEDFA